MAEEKNNHSNLAAKSAQAANTVRGAVKTGKAIAGAAKGAAAGGPYGAVAGAVWGARKHIGTIAIVVIVILLLPVLFILMLPSIIFGSLFGGSADPSAEPIMNNNAAIIENTNEIAFAINQILGEGIDDVEQRIASDFAQTGGDNYEIVNPYTEDMVSNTNAFIGQYCAAKDEDWENISLADLEQTLRAFMCLRGLGLLDCPIIIADLGLTPKGWELALRLTPLPQLMEELAHRTEEPARRLFSACRRALDGLERETFAHAWRRLTDQLPVSPEAKRALYPLGEVLGRYDGRGQQAAIAGARRELEGLRARAGEERLRLGKVYGALGVTAGAFLVILLL